MPRECCIERVQVTSRLGVGVPYPIHNDLVAENYYSLIPTPIRQSQDYYHFNLNDTKEEGVHGCVYVNACVNVYALT